MNNLSNSGASVGLESLLADLHNLGPATDDVPESAAQDDSVTGGVINVDEAEPAPVVTLDKKAIAAAAREKRAADKKTAAEKLIADRAAASTKKAADKEAKKKIKDAEVAAQAEKDAAEPALEAKPVEARVFSGRNKLGRLESKLGADIGNVMLLTVTEAELEGDALIAQLEANKAAFKLLAVKVANRATNVIEFVTGKSLKLNPVIEIVIRLLAKDRMLKTGDTGNIFAKLSTLYTGGAARSMGNSTLGMLKALQIVTESEKQFYVPNPASTMLALISAKLSLSFIDQAAALKAAEKVEEKAVAARTKKAPVTPMEALLANRQAEVETA